MQAQKRLDKNADLFRQAQAERRTAVVRAFQSGVSVQQLSDELEVSRAKLYELLGGVRSSKTDRSPRAAV
jgi:DNA-binding transcriptional regulator YdaS (Cro superfamily)